MKAESSKRSWASRLFGPVPDGPVVEGTTLRLRGATIRGYWLVVLDDVIATLRFMELANPDEAPTIARIRERFEEYADSNDETP